MSETPQEMLSGLLGAYDRVSPPRTVNLSPEGIEAIRAVLAENKRLASMCCVCEGDCCNGKRKAEAERDALLSKLAEAGIALADCGTALIATEAKLAGMRLVAVREADLARLERDRLEAEVARLRAAACEPCPHIDRAERAETEVARLRDIISPGDAAAYEEGMAALQCAANGLKQCCEEQRADIESLQSAHNFMHEEVERAEAEVARLRTALEWYGEKAEAFARLKGKPSALEAVYVEMSLDNGRRARAALAPAQPVVCGCPDCAPEVK